MQSISSKLGDTFFDYAIQQPPITNKYYLQLADHTLLDLIKQALHEILTHGTPVEELAIIQLQREVYIIYDNTTVNNEDIIWQIQNEIRCACRCQRKIIDMAHIQFEKDKPKISDMREADNAWSISWEKYKELADQYDKKTCGLIGTLFCNSYHSLIQSVKEIESLLKHLIKECLINPVNFDELRRDLNTIIILELLLKTEAFDPDKVLPVLTPALKEKFVFSYPHCIELRKEFVHYEDEYYEEELFSSVFFQRPQKNSKSFDRFDNDADYDYHADDKSAGAGIKDIMKELFFEQIMTRFEDGSQYRKYRSFLNSYEDDADDEDDYQDDFEEKYKKFGQNEERDEILDLNQIKSSQSESSHAAQTSTKSYIKLKAKEEKETIEQVLKLQNFQRTLSSGAEITKTTIKVPDQKQQISSESISFKYVPPPQPQKSKQQGKQRDEAKQAKGKDEIRKQVKITKEVFTKSFVDNSGASKFHQYIPELKQRFSEIQIQNTYINSAKDSLSLGFTTKSKTKSYTIQTKKDLLFKTQLLFEKKDRIKKMDPVKAEAEVLSEEANKKKKKRNNKKKKNKNKKTQADEADSKDENQSNQKEPAVVKKVVELSEEQKLLANYLENLSIDDKSRIECKVPEEKIERWKSRLLKYKNPPSIVA